eukprot:jgi/Psemu1/241676/estExt_Genewise1.C_2380005
MDADMQAAFEAYMLGGSKNSKTSSVPPSPLNESRDEHYSSRRKKGYRPILKAYQGRIEEWKDTVQQLEGVTGSIANLRDRVYWENGRLEQLSSVENFAQEQKPADRRLAEEKARQRSWRDSGFRSGGFGGGALRKEDVHLALHHDLLQHERMLSALRSLLASLAHTVDDIGRRLDEWMMYELTDPYIPAGVPEDEKLLAARLHEEKAFQLAQDVYSLLALDLYRRQEMAVRIFESCHDGVLERGDDGMDPSNDAFWMPDPRGVSKQALKEFSSTSTADPTLNAVNRLMSIT